MPFFWGKASVAYQGGWVYRDFASYHAPLFSYIITLPILLWYTPKAIVLLMVLMEAGIIWGTYRTYKSLHNDAFKSVMLYIILSAPAVMVLLGGQEDEWLWGVAVWMLYYFLRTKNDGLGLGLRFSSGLIVIKATAGFWLFPLWVLLKKKGAFLVGMLLIGIPILVILYLLMGLDFLMPLEQATNLLTPNLFTVLRPLITAILGHAPHLPTFTWIGMVITLSSAVWIIYPARHQSLVKTLPLAFLATYIAMTIFQLTSPGYYVFTYMLPLVMELVDWKKSIDTAILLIFNALLVVQPFLFTHLNSPTYDDITVLANPLFLLEYTLQFLNVACYGWYFRKVHQKARYSV
ncbi:hypothetical protein [Runella slithyformis]|uniref:hypothetical protein n=1 Tax=Runella slithyformis TaxID=106 RepID=UPI00146F2C54|nr:hypothetical protein [Runella slithyformis]